MAEQIPIWARAREDLVLLDDQGHEDVFLWEHSVRVARSTRVIAAMPEVPGDKLDHTVLTAAALYHDAGWAIGVRRHELARAAVFARATTKEQRELAADLLEERLADKLPPQALRRSVDCIDALNRRNADIPEAQVLADADYLDQIGPLLLCQVVRRLGVAGKGVQATIDAWLTRKSYHFWDSWIEAFHFDSVRAVARDRLAKVDRFMSDLARQHGGEDLGLSAADFKSASTAIPPSSF